MSRWGEELLEWKWIRAPRKLSTHQLVKWETNWPKETIEYRVMSWLAMAWNMEEKGEESTLLPEGILRSFCYTLCTIVHTSKRLAGKSLWRKYHLPNAEPPTSDIRRQWCDAMPHNWNCLLSGTAASESSHWRSCWWWWWCCWWYRTVSARPALCGSRQTAYIRINSII